MSIKAAKLIKKTLAKEIIHHNGLRAGKDVLDHINYTVNRLIMAACELQRSHDKVAKTLKPRYIDLARLTINPRPK